MREFGWHGNKSPLTAFPQNDASIVYETGVNNFPKETRFRLLIEHIGTMDFVSGRSKAELHNKYKHAIHPY